MCEVPVIHLALFSSMMTQFQISQAHHFQWDHLAIPRKSALCCTNYTITNQRFTRDQAAGLPSYLIDSPRMLPLSQHPLPVLRWHWGIT